jgi:hypothetical protein
VAEVAFLPIVHNGDTHDEAVNIGLIQPYDAQTLGDQTGPISSNPFLDCETKQ